ncbi:MAG TPA: DNA polymerase III subunit delta' [Nitrospinae bacterium]|nr:DNA polymerase III subunit delta' [Nitrospinota bacterium]HBA27768.1 DNA polymerase III subunit delta' [Nitrospinota bacterium]
MSFNNILGQERAKKILINSLIKGNISHAYIFAGPEEVGKKLTALTFAKALNCINGKEDCCEECLSCKKINSLNHPDLIIIRKGDENTKINTISDIKRDFGDEDKDKESKSIKIGAIRELQRRLSLKSYEGKKKLAIIDNAEDMTREALNSFLKTLEEPLGETVIILITSNTHSLLPTVVSRCQVIKFNPLSDEHIKEILIKNYKFSENDASTLSSLSKGRLGSALSMDYESFCKFREDALKLLGSSIKGDLEYVFTESKRLSSDKDKLPQFLDLVADLLRDAVAIKGIGTDENVINKDVSDKIRGFSDGLHIHNILNMVDSVQQTKSLLDRNANHQLAIEVMMLNIAGGYR